MQKILTESGSRYFPVPKLHKTALQEVIGVTDGDNFQRNSDRITLKTYVRRIDTSN